MRFRKEMRNDATTDRDAIRQNRRPAQYGGVAIHRESALCNRDAETNDPDLCATWHHHQAMDINLTNFKSSTVYGKENEITSEAIGWSGEKVRSKKEN